ncbi:MAG: hypothetical protein ABIH72_03020 [archaeon]
MIITMASTHKHIISAYNHIKETQPDFYEKNKDAVEEIIVRVNDILDYFARPEIAQKYGYTDDNLLKHRELMHHRTGLSRITSCLVAEYGEDYRNIIREIAERHVQEDMGAIHEEYDFWQPGFWWKFRAKALWKWVKGEII